MFAPLTEHIEIDRTQRRIRKDGTEVHLTGFEYGLLEYLVSHANRICTRNELLEYVWGEKTHYDTSKIDVHLNALRRKMDWHCKEPIETIRGVGFIFRLEKKITHYTIDLHSFLTEWLQSHEAEIKSVGLVVYMRLTPFVNEITIKPESLRKMLDSVLQALLPNAQPGMLRLTSKLTVLHFILSLDINGTVNELRIPINGDFSLS